MDRPDLRMTGLRLYDSIRQRTVLARTLLGHSGLHKSQSSQRRRQSSLALLDYRLDLQTVGGVSS